MNNRAYKIYNLRTKSVMESANVVVNDTTISNIHESGILGDTTIFEIVEYDSEKSNEIVYPNDLEITE